MFAKKKKYRLHLTIQKDSQPYYQGSFQELPFPEPLILSKSIQFFDDPEPCYLHRSAVRNRLLYELEAEFNSLLPTGCDQIEGDVSLSPGDCPLLLSYTGFEDAEHIMLYMA